MDIQIIQPTPKKVVQTDENNQAGVDLYGNIKHHKVEDVKIEVMSDSDCHQTLEIGKDGSFSGVILLPVGWHKLTFKAIQEGIIIKQIQIDQIGVGEVFVTAGQSNSANHGYPCQETTSGNVMALGLEGWQVANDPQPIATGEGGTPWPLLGDQFSQKLSRPIGFVSVGWGGTTVNQWQPSIQDGLYSRLRAVLKQLRPNGLRAILWHQGESDTILGTSSDEYANRMEKVIRQSEMDIGQSVSWFIAEVSYIGPDHQHKQTEIINGQRELVRRGFAAAGPTTDDLIGEQYRYDSIHFGQVGLEIHAQKWDACLSRYFGW